MGLIDALTEVFYKEPETLENQPFDARRTRVMAAMKRFARGGVAIQSGHILTQERFDAELDALKLKIESDDYGLS